MTFTVKGQRLYLLDGEPLPSVTTILQQWPKQLVGWAMDQAAVYAVEHWDELGDLPSLERMRSIIAGANSRSGQARTRGTKIHTYGEALVAGEVVDVPAEYVGPAQAYARFLDRWQVKPIIVERPIVNRTRRYAGRPDLLATIGSDSVPTLLDIKTGKSVYEDAALQLCAYGHAENWLDGDGAERPWQEPEQYAVVHVGPDSADLRMVEVDERTWRTFLYVREAYLWAQECREAFKAGVSWPIGEPLVEVETTAVSR